jgi:5-methylcytosine-specific restriction endonuclease McrA
MENAKISQIMEWHKLKHLNLNPAYQRLGGVWGVKDKEELIVTIMNDLPMPEMFFHYRDKKSVGYIYDVVDGKQRLQTIIDYIKGRFASRISLNEKEKEKFFFRQFKVRQSDFLKYPIRFFEVKDLDMQHLTEIFVRINRTGRKLKPQEIRNAKFKGDFIILAKELCSTGKTSNYFVKQGTISEAAKKRMGDIEFACELLAYIQDGVQDKKKSLDAIIGDNERLPKRKATKSLFVKIISFINKVLPNLQETRLKQKSDFYSLFGAITDLLHDGYLLEERKYQTIANLILTSFSNAVDKYQTTKKGKREIMDYYASTQEGTDTREHRTLRINYLKRLLSPAIGKKDKKRIFSPEVKRLIWNSSSSKRCGICHNPIDTWDELEIDHKKPYACGGLTQLKNGQAAHAICNKKKGKKKC